MSNADRGSKRAPTLSTTEARQGVTGHNVRYVLIVSTALVIAGFVVVWAYHFY